jgi:aromatic ring hydroxylase
MELPDGLIGHSTFRVQEFSNRLVLIFEKVLLPLEDVFHCRQYSQGQRLYLLGYELQFVRESFQAIGEAQILRLQSKIENVSLRFARKAVKETIRKVN